MSCCGNSRKQYQAPAHNPAAMPSPAPEPEQMQEPVYYEYTGATAISVRGSATGNIYRFREFGSRVAVDSRDTATLDTVPNVRRVV